MTLPPSVDYLVKLTQIDVEMTAMDYDLNDVVVFTKVVETRSFTAAGKALGLPNSSVSRKVSRLEEHLGTQLLQRTTRKLNLTDAGQLYYERSVRLISGLDEAEAVLAHSRSTPRGRVKLSAPPEHEFSMHVVNEFLRRHPEVRVDVEFSSEQINIIQEGYDVALVAGEVQNLSVVAHRLFDSPFQLLVSPGYLERRGTPRTVADLSDHDCLVFGGSSLSGSWSLRDGREVVKVPVQGRIAANHIGALKSAVLAGHGIGLLPKLAFHAELAAGSVVEILPGASPEPVPVSVTYASGRFLTPAVRALVDFIKEELPPKAQAALDC